MEGEQGGAPAGWYPDPLGLPQLRWWDGTQWSEFVSEPAMPAASEPEPEAPVVDAEPAFVDPLADFLNGNISRAGATGVNPVVLPGGGSTASTPVVPSPVESALAASAEAVPASAEAPAFPEPRSEFGAPLTTMEIPQLIGYDDEGREFIEPVVPIVTTPGAAPVPPGGEPTPAESTPPVPSTPAEPAPAAWAPAQQVPVEPAAPPSLPVGDVGGFAPPPQTSEQFLLAPRSADPFATASSTVDADPESGETFGSRRALREYRRQREIEAGPLEEPVESPVANATIGAAPLGVPQPAVSSGAPVVPVPLGTTPGFRLESTEIAEDYPPERRLLDKPTYSGASFLLALLGVFPAAVIALLVVVLGLGDNHGLVWGVWAATWLMGILLAFYDRLKLKSWGHANTASPLLAIFTPIIYLVARNTATKGETGHGSKVLVYWIIGLLLMVGIVFLVPQVLEASIPGVKAFWTSPLRP